MAQKLIEDMKLAGLAATTQESLPPGGQVSGEALQSVAGALLLRLSALECLTSLADGLAYYALC